MPVYVREIERSQDGRRHAGELAKALRQKIMPHVALSRVSISRQGNNLHIDVSLIVSKILVTATRATSSYAPSIFNSDAFPTDSQDTNYFAERGRNFSLVRARMRGKYSLAIFAPRGITAVRSSTRERCNLPMDIFHVARTKPSLKSEINE